MERMSRAYRVGALLRRLLGLSPRADRTFMLMGQVFHNEDWRVSGRRQGRLLVCYCGSYPEALNEVAYLRGLGYRDLRLRRGV